MAVSKSTKKFEKKHLASTLKRRNESSKEKQKQKEWARKKGKGASTTTTTTKDGDVTASASARRRKPAGLADEAFASMATDKFFEGRVDVPEMDKKVKKKLDAKKKKSQASKEAESESEDEDEEQSEFGQSDDDVDVDEEDSGVEALTADSDDDGGDFDDNDSDEDNLEKHQAQLEALKEKDPEFFKYLEENDTELLNFDDADDLVLSEDENDAAAVKAGGDESDTDNETASKKTHSLTTSMVDKWKKELDEKQSLRALREVAVAFRAAASLNLDDKTDRVYRYSITSPDVYHHLLLVTLKDIPQVLQHHIPLTESKTGKVRFDSDSKHFRSLTPILKSHLSALQKLLAGLSDDASIRLCLDSIGQIVPYVLSFKKGVRDLIRTVADVWSGAGNSDPVRISAFLVLQRLVVVSDAGTAEAVLKTVYQSLVKESRNTNIHTVAAINLMKNSAAQLWGHDGKTGYTTGFTFIRQLAIHLRTSITQNGKEAFKAVYNWQFVHSLDFWSRVVSAHCNSLTEASRGQESPLRPLIYPIVQLSLGVIRLIPTAAYFPLRFHLIRSLIRISASTSTYIPLGPTIFEVVNSAEMRKPAKPSTAKPLDFETSIRASKSYLGTRVYQDGVADQVSDLLSESFVLWSTHVSFPELVLPVVVMLKRWLRDVSSKSTGNRNGKANAAIGTVVHKLEANAKFIDRARAAVDFAPNNRAGVEAFSKNQEWADTPLGGYVAAQRVVRDERRKVLDQSRREMAKRRRGGGDDNDEDEDEDDGDDSDSDFTSKTAAKKRKRAAETKAKSKTPAGVFEAESDSE